MVKLLLLAIIVWLLFLIIKRYTGSLRKDSAPTQGSDAIMVQCRHCGLHVPKSDSIVSGDDYYCCEEHRRQSD